MPTQTTNDDMEGTKCTSCGCLAEHRTCFSSNHSRPSPTVHDSRTPNRTGLPDEDNRYEYICDKCYESQIGIIRFVLAMRRQERHWDRG